MITVTKLKSIPTETSKPSTWNFCLKFISLLQPQSFRWQNKFIEHQHLQCTFPKAFKKNEGKNWKCFVKYGFTAIKRWMDHKRNYFLSSFHRRIAFNKKISRIWNLDFQFCEFSNIAIVEPKCVFFAYPTLITLFSESQMCQRNFLVSDIFQQ